MFPEGTIVTLKVDKAHGNNEHAYRLRAGVCGMIVQTNRSGDGNHRYVVDFGAEGQWNCVDQELDGGSQEADFEEPEERVPGPLIIPERSREPEEEQMAPAEAKPGAINAEKDISERIKQLNKGKIA